MAGIGDGFKNIFLAGIGAAAITGEKGKELIDALVAKGELTVEQGKELNTELKHKVDDAAAMARESALEARMMAMTPEERTAFAKKAAKIAATQNKAEAQVDVQEVASEVAPVDVDKAASEAVESSAAAKPHGTEANA